MSITFTQMLLGFFILFIAIQSGYFFFFFRRFNTLRGGEVIALSDRKPVSIIICTRNEAANLVSNLPKVLSQSYADELGVLLYDVIVVNDGSADDSLSILNELKQQYPHLKVAENRVPGKKNALSVGVAAAQHEWLVMIDADCCPASDTWLARITEPFATGKEIILGYGGYNHEPGILNAFILWETMHTFLQYSTYALAGLPYMAVGRNMACTKQTLLYAMQQPIWAALPSGDDDMLVRIAGSKHNTAVVLHEAAFTSTDAKTSWTDWANQKRRHLSTGKYYKWPIQLLLGVYGIAHAGMWLTFGILLFSSYMKVALVLMVLRCFLYWRVWESLFMLFNQRKLRYLLPVFDLGWMMYNFAFLPYIAFKNKRNWK